MRDLLARNADWAAARIAEDAGYFDRLCAQQAPAYFWIGCSDSRVPANVVAGLAPGEVFVHRNVANVVHSADLNMLAALEYAVEVLRVREVIVCGHYGCGGIHAATEDMPHGLADHWLEPVRRLAQAHTAQLDAQPDNHALRDRLAELNVIEGVSRVAATPIMRKAWARGRDLRVHGLIYALSDGRLRDLGCTLGSAAG